MRLCRAKGGKAIFHKWNEVAQIIPPSPMIGGHGGGEIRYATAIVEYENGQITEITANDVVFCDTKEVMKRLNAKKDNEIAALKARLENAIELPCKVGDILWYINYTKTGVEPIEITNIDIHKNRIIIYAHPSRYSWTLNDIDKTVFLTREDAEKALSERLLKNEM